MPTRKKQTKDQPKTVKTLIRVQYKSNEYNYLSSNDVSNLGKDWQSKAIKHSSVFSFEVAVDKFGDPVWDIAEVDHFAPMYVPLDCVEAIHGI